MANERWRYGDFREEYRGDELRREMLDPDPFIQFSHWFEDACQHGVIEPNGCFLATASPEGRPSCRAILMKHFDADGLYFFTNCHSRKAFELAANPFAAITFWWAALQRQVRLEGSVVRLDSDLAAHYFAERPRRSQLSSWASHQGECIAAKSILEKAYADHAAEFEGRTIPPPPYWGGFCLRPTLFEFWQGSPRRLHDRFLYLFVPPSSWEISRLSP